jgi:micrococcal nuclease
VQNESNDLPTRETKPPKRELPPGFVTPCCHAQRVLNRSSAAVAVMIIALAGPVLAGCVKAQGPVVQSVPNQPATNGTNTNPPGGETPLSTTNSGVDAQTGAVVVEAIRKGPLQANGTVTHLVDGDTVDVAFKTGNGTSTTERIRMIGIDTPETKRPDTPIECFGREASSALAALIPVGTAVFIERDVEERDRYGRLLGYVFRANDGLFVNHEMVRAGMATAYTFPPNIAYVDVFIAAGDASRSTAAGLWSRCESGHTPATG